jgi:hypothetical protein
LFAQNPREGLDEADELEQVDEVIGKYARKPGEDEPNGAHGRRKTEMRGDGAATWHELAWYGA